MTSALGWAGDWGHALVAALFAAVAIWTSRRRDAGLPQHVMVAALTLTALWALYVSFGGVATLQSGLFESLRNFGWLVFLFVLLHRGEDRAVRQPWGVNAIYGTLALMLVVQVVADLVLQGELEAAPLHEGFYIAGIASRMMVAVGSLVLVHHLYTASAPETRGKIRLAMVALAGMWVYDLNLYIIAYLAPTDAFGLYAMRGVAMTFIAPLFALGARQAGRWDVRLSRTFTFRSLSFVAVGGYLAIMIVLTDLLDRVGGPYARMIQLGAVFGLSVAALALLPVARFRAWGKVQIAKHFFQHRYDYRSEWIRFADTIGRPNPDAAPLFERVVQAVADIMDCPGGLLMLPRDEGGLETAAAWRWPGGAAPYGALTAAEVDAMRQGGWIAELDADRARATVSGVPGWLMQEPAAWIVVPLTHFGRLTGVIVLARPAYDRRLDWEDLDMLRVVGRQAASYIAEAQGQEALSDAQRFDEFNRRFAFIMHDIKNLVSQISLLARNAERHAENPEFRADMIETLRESAGKMNDLLARLSQHNTGRAEEPRPIDLRPIVAAVARAKGRQHAVRLDETTPALWALADPARVEQIVLHLVQNAIDASPCDLPVQLTLALHDGCPAIEIRDLGCGMSAEFVRTQLFRPFTSSKEGGFGIGAFEARSLAMAMGGRLEVQSRVGAGTCFTLILRQAPADQMNDVSRKDRAA